MSSQKSEWTKDGWKRVTYRQYGTAGYAKYSINKCWLHYMTASPEKQGMGTKILDIVEDDMKCHGCAQISLLALPDSKGFYFKRGYYHSNWDYFSPNKLVKDL